jgi:hypothetical protein
MIPMEHAVMDVGLRKDLPSSCPRCSFKVHRHVNGIEAKINSSFAHLVHK